MASIAKTIEVQAEGNTIEEAVEVAVEGASQSVRNIENVYVRDFEAIVENGQVSHYRVDTKVTFLIDQGGDVG
ncbi:MAG: dodecin domain-containing protein [Bacteroidetes bacterium QS_8_68_28]|jgi:flavin-binding protein dodecin|nr:MAG: dodecin domain-containing protein [Bacteroidetes bacterium QS_8_68_28]